MYVGQGLLLLNFEEILLIQEYGMLAIVQYIFWIGCQNSPGKKTRFCPEHEDAACSLRDDSSAKMAESASVVGKDEEIDVLLMKILNERETRQGKFYEVRRYTKSLATFGHYL